VTGGDDDLTDFRRARLGDARRRWAFAAILVLALVLRLGYVAVTPDYRIVHDARDYDVHARSIASGHGFALLGPGPTRKTAFRPPAYPVLLAGVYSLGGHKWKDTHGRILPGRIANALVGTAVVALIGVLCMQLFDRRVALAPEGDCSTLSGASGKVHVTQWDCVLMLDPLPFSPGAGGVVAHLEYLGSTASGTTPCATHGLPGSGSSVGIKVPMLVQ